MIEGIARSFRNEGYAADLKYSGRPPVSAAFIRYPGLPHELGFSAHPGEMLAVKIEVDGNPPAGGKTETTIVRRHLLLNILHYDRSTLLAGKLHALLMPPLYKRQGSLRPVLVSWRPLLARAEPGVPQPGTTANPLAGTRAHPGELEKEIDARLSAIDWQQAVADVRPFIERSEELEMLTLPNLKKLLG